MSEATTPRLKVSREGVVLIKSFEGFRPHAVRADDGRWVIGYGHTASAREGLTVGEQDAELLLQYDLLPVVRALNERAPASLNQHQFDALASFAISVGVDRFLASDVLQRLNAGEAVQAADALIGWPETPSPDARLRRRAAERALFVADPGSAVTLADLLAAPLPAPTAAPVEPEPDSAGARAAAVAALLGETPATVTAPLDEAEPDRDAAGETAAAAPVAEPAPRPVAFSAGHMQRYSPYAAAIIGPLPGFEAATPVEQPPAAAPVADAAVGAPAAEADAAPAPASRSVDPTPVIPLVSPPPGPSPFPDLDQPLVLTPLTEADVVAVERPVWPDALRETPAAADGTVLFDDEPTAPVLRHEVEPARPRRFDWADTGAFLIMGGVGLAACGASAAAFRLAVEQPSPMGETSVIAWALALIGVLCVGVSSWNLYVRWGRPD
ncbi:lysozyme [Brevundimonas sp.]|uniref:lysozyme n=1 Tax=Brevundimonas sp. TaxID=1871086 RepID=UPI002FCA93F1